MWIMESILIFLVVTLMMSSPASCISESMSCSMVNGRSICEKQTSQGNSALAFGGAAIGNGQTYQDAYAGAGNPGQSWDSGRQTFYGTVPGRYGAPPPGNAPGPNYGPTGNAPGPNYGPTGNAPGPNYGPTGVSSGVFSSSSSSSSDYIPGQAGEFAGGFVSTGSFPAGGGGFAFGGGYPAPGGAAAGGFATGGFSPFGGGYPAQPPPQQPEAPNQGPPPQQGFDPFMFVRPFFGGGGPVAVAGGFAGMPFGRR